MKVTIELPAKMIVTSRGVEQEVTFKDLSPEIIAELVQHGATQKIADAASQAKSVAEESDTPIEDVTGSMMAKAYEALCNGEWSRRTGGGGVSEETRIARLVTRRLVKAKFGAKSEEWATFTGLDTAEQNAKLDEWFTANESALAPERDAEIARRKEAAEAKRKATKAVEFSL